MEAKRNYRLEVTQRGTYPYPTDYVSHARLTKREAEKLAYLIQNYGGTAKAVKRENSR